ncbi:MAG: M28 family peptidase [Planctomycetota bacterium]
MLHVLPVVLSLLQTTAPQPLPELTAAEREAMAVVTVDRVRGAVSFLACDELQGRDTGSPGLAIAAQYVASRFRALGLEGLGPDGSYFIETELEASQQPSEGVRVEHGGKPVAGVAIYSATAEAYAFDGEFGKADGGPVLVDLPEPPRNRGRIPMSYLVFQAMRQAQAGKAGAVLLRTPAESPLWASAKAAAREPRVGRTLGGAFGRLGGKPLPVVLVPADLELDGRVRVEVPALVTHPRKVRNVAACLRGRDPDAAKRALLFSAHLDHIGVGAPVDGDGVFNGADDDASGVTAVLELAEAYAALPQRPRHSLLFVTFWGEEKGLLGSRRFAADPPWPLADVIANVNIEMIGRPEPDDRGTSWMTGWTKSDLGELVAEGAARAGVKVYEHPQLSARLYGASDNMSFVEKGVIAHSFSSSSLHADYHGVGDEWTKLDAGSMTKVIHGLFAGTLPLAEGLRTPGRR